ncbi:MAG TPA: hypothetical protein VFW28_10265 [Micropepsaceae bacterium]|nr:hypothetical protein [Micropepsaceae bacterium]
MSRDEWKIRLHLTCAGELRSMAGKMLGNGRAELIKIAEGHEQVAKSLEGTRIGEPQLRTGTA